MAAVRTDDVYSLVSMNTTDVNVPLIFEPNTTAPVYLNGNLAAIPYTEFWKIPPAAKRIEWNLTQLLQCIRMCSILVVASSENQIKSQSIDWRTIQNHNGSHGHPEENIRPFIRWHHGQSDGYDENNHLNYYTPYDSWRQTSTEKNRNENAEQRIGMKIHVLFTDANQLMELIL